VVHSRFQSAFTEAPSSKRNSFGTTVQPSRTPVKPTGLENELTSMAHSRAPSTSKMDRGSSGSRMYSAYAASKTITEPLCRAAATRAASCACIATAPVGLLGEQK